MKIYFNKINKPASTRTMSLLCQFGIVGIEFRIVHLQDKDRETSFLYTYIYGEERWINEFPWERKETPPEFGLGSLIPLIFLPLPLF